MYDINLCKFCEEKLNENENINKLTQKGIEILLEAAVDRNDKASRKLFQAKEKNDWCNIKLLNACRCKYVSKEKRSSFKGSIQKLKI